MFPLSPKVNDDLNAILTSCPYPQRSVPSRETGFTQQEGRPPEPYFSYSHFITDKKD